MSERFVRRADPLLEATQSVWVLLRVVLAAAVAIGMFLAVAAGYFLVPFFMVAAVLALVGGLVTVRLARRFRPRMLRSALSGRSLAAAGRAGGRGARAVITAPLAVPRALSRELSPAQAAAGLARLATRVHWSYSLLALASAVVVGGVAVEAALWDAAPGSPGAIVGGLYWVAASVAMLGLLLIASRSARRERRLEEAITAHDKQLQQAAHSLREAEERFNTLAATSPDGIAVVDALGNVLLFNGAICELFGYEPAEMERLNLDRLAPSDERERVRAFRASLLEHNDASSRIETRHLRKDGGVIDVELSAFPFRESGEAAGLLVELRDISERKRAQAETERQALQQAALAELGVSALKTSDAGWLMQEAAALACTTLDVEYCAVMELDPKQHELVLRAGAGWSDGLVGETAEPLIEGSQAVHALLATEQPVSFRDLRSETRFSPMPLLRAHDVLSGVSVVIEGSGKPLGVLGAFSSRPREFAANDAHFLQAVANVLASAVERATAERAVRDSEQRFRQMIETARSGIALLDMKGRVLLANSAAAEMLGYSEEEVAELAEDESRWPNITQFVGAADAELIVGLFEAQLRGDDDIPTHFQFEAIRRDGRKIDVDVSYSVLERSGRSRRRPDRGQGHHRRPAPEGAPVPVAEERGVGHTRRRGRARLQQPAHGDRRRHRDGDGPDRGRVAVA